MNCVNCGIAVETKFCPNCGQKAGVKRITFKEGWFDFWARIYGFDGQFPRTLRDLTWRPGFASREFIKGNRMSYYGPVGYFFLMITVLLLVMSLLDIDTVDFLNKGNSFSPLQPKIRSNQASFIAMVLGFISEYIKILAFLIIPVQALMARYVFFRKSGFNFMEHSVLPLFVQGHLYWLTILNVFVYKVFGGWIFPQLIAAVSLVYFGYAYVNFMDYQLRWKAFLKGLAVFLFAQLIFMACAGAVVMIIIWLNPEFYEMVRPSNNP